MKVSEFKKLINTISDSREIFFLVDRYPATPKPVVPISINNINDIATVDGEGNEITARIERSSVEIHFE